MFLSATVILIQLLIASADTPSTPHCMSHCETVPNFFLRPVLGLRESLWESGEETIEKIDLGKVPLKVQSS